MRPIRINRKGWPRREAFSGAGRWCVVALVLLGMVGGCEVLLPIFGQLFGGGDAPTTPSCPPAPGSAKANHLQVAIETSFITIEDNVLETIGIDLDLMLDIENVDAATRRFTPVTPTNDPLKLFPEDLGAGSLSNFALDSLPAAGNPPAVAEVLGSLLDDTQLQLLIQAAEQDNKVSVLSAPHLTVLNCQAAHIMVGNEIRSVPELQPDFANRLFQIDPLIPFVTTGPSLTVIPEITSDDRIRLTIQPNVAVTFSTPDVQANVNGVPVLLDRPLIRIARVRTTVSVPDGGTVLLGGLMLSDQTEVSGTLPLLGRIPILGRLFDNRTFVKDQQELLLLVTPRIVLQEDE